MTNRRAIRDDVWLRSYGYVKMRVYKLRDLSIKMHVLIRIYICSVLMLKKIWKL